MNLLHIQFTCLCFYYLVSEYTIHCIRGNNFVNIKPMPLIFTLYILNHYSWLENSGQLISSQHFEMLAEWSILSLRQLHLFSKILSLCLFEYCFSPFLLFFPSDTPIKHFLETLILVPMLMEFHSPTHFCPFISVCNELGEFLSFTFQFTNSFFDYVHYRVYAIDYTLIPMAIFFIFRTKSWFFFISFHSWFIPFCLNILILKSLWGLLF